MRFDLSPLVERLNAAGRNQGQGSRIEVGDNAGLFRSEPDGFLVETVTVLSLK